MTKGKNITAVYEWVRGLPMGCRGVTHRSAKGFSFEKIRIESNGGTGGGVAGGSRFPLSRLDGP
jgi:hypothetical protein